MGPLSVSSGGTESIEEPVKQTALTFARAVLHTGTRKHDGLCRKQYI